MVNKSLPAMPSSHNDIESLAGLLEDNFQYHSKRNPSYKEEYLTHFNLIVGLSFTAIMVRASFVSKYQSDFNRFLDCFSFYRSSECNSIKPVSLEAARIMYEAACFFPRIESCREFNEMYRKMLEETVKAGLLDTTENDELSDRLLKTMLAKHSLY